MYDFDWKELGKKPIHSNASNKVLFMEKKIKFPLEMHNGIQVRAIEELKAHFGLNKVIGYFLYGKLLAWMETRYYDNESIALRKLLLRQQ